MACKHALFTRDACMACNQLGRLKRAFKRPSGKSRLSQTERVFREGFHIGDAIIAGRFDSGNALYVRPHNRRHAAPGSNAQPVLCRPPRGASGGATGGV